MLEIKTFHLKNGKGEVPDSWKPFAVVGAKHGLDIWVVASHEYMHDADKLLKGEQ